MINDKRNKEKVLSELIDTMRDMLEQDEICETGMILLTTKTGIIKLSTTSDDWLRNLKLLVEGMHAVFEDSNKK